MIQTNDFVACATVLHGWPQHTTSSWLQQFLGKLNRNPPLRQWHSRMTFVAFFSKISTATYLAVLKSELRAR